jgi:hypothetical protein
MRRSPSKFPDYENLDNEGSPGSHKKYYQCESCWGVTSESVEKHNYTKDLDWYCICGAADPTRYKS